jgi:predicted RNA-binding Zn-ribbon protein involved in translation (DUF1610 family)
VNLASAYDPLPAIVLLAAGGTFVAAVVILYLRGCRRPRGPFVCVKCGFDLRGSAKPGPVTCPECGSVYE